MSRAIRRATFLRGEDLAHAPLMSIRQCECPGCDNLAWGETRCNTCRDEIDALDRMAAQQDEREHRRAERNERRIKTAIEIWLSVLDWVRESEIVNWAQVLFLVGAIGYISVQYGVAIAEWLKQLGGVQ